MILAVDIGNTETMLGLFEGREERASWRLATVVRRTGDEVALLLRGLVGAEVGAEPWPVARGVIASVVPPLDRAWSQAFERLDLPLHWVDASSPLPVRLDVEAPSTVGADRVVNTLATSVLHGRNTIVVDLGTATTFDCITDEGVFLGGAIAPGPHAGIDRGCHRSWSSRWNRSFVRTLFQVTVDRDSTAKHGDWAHYSRRARIRRILGDCRWHRRHGQTDPR